MKINFKTDPREFNETRWVTLAKVKELVSDENTLKALEQEIFTKLD